MKVINYLKWLQADGSLKGYAGSFNRNYVFYYNFMRLEVQRKLFLPPTLYLSPPRSIVHFYSTQLFVGHLILSPSCPLRLVLVSRPPSSPLLHILLFSLYPAQPLFSLLPQVFCIGYSHVQDILLALEPLDLQLEEADVFHPLVVVEVPLAQDRLLNPDLLIQQRTLIVAVEKLLAQVVPLSDHLERSFINK